MADYTGAVAVPVSTLATPIGDPLRSMLGGFLQAAIRAGCQAAWDEIGGGTDVVERVETNDPADNTFVSTRLPALFVYRDGRNRKTELFTADHVRIATPVVALWIPQLAIQEWKATREPFWHAVEAVVMNAVAKGRTPGWHVYGDTDAVSLVEGSNISAALGLQKPLHLTPISFEDTVLDIEIDRQPTKHFPALKITFSLWEDSTSGALGAIYPAAVDVNLENDFDEETGSFEDLPT